MAIHETNAADSSRVNALEAALLEHAASEEQSDSEELTRVRDILRELCTILHTNGVFEEQDTGGVRVKKRLGRLGRDESEARSLFAACTAWQALRRCLLLLIPLLIAPLAAAWAVPAVRVFLGEHFLWAFLGCAAVTLACFIIVNRGRFTLAGLIVFVLWEVLLWFLSGGQGGRLLLGLSATYAVLLVWAFHPFEKRALAKKGGIASRGQYQVKSQKLADLCANGALAAGKVEGSIGLFMEAAHFDAWSAEQFRHMQEYYRTLHSSFEAIISKPVQMWGK